MNALFSDVKTKLTKLLYNKKICCVCFENDSNLLELEFHYNFVFSQREQKVTLRQILKELFASKVHIFSDFICQKCNDHVLKSYVFLKNVETNAQLLEKYINQMEIETEEVFLHLTNMKSELKAPHLNAILLLVNDIDVENTKINYDFFFTDLEEECNGFSNTEKNQETFVCDNCNMVFNNKCNLKGHLSKNCCRKLDTKKVLLKPKKKCPVCLASSCVHDGYLQTFQLTKKASNKIQKGKCADCNYSTSTKNLLIQHVNQKHLHVPATFICEICGAGFYSNHHLEKHKSLNHLEKIYCPFCDNVMRDQDHLEKHKADCEKEERPIKCEHCPASFRSKSRAGKHNLKHGKSFPCDECAFVMSTELSLQYHKAVKHKGLLSNAKPQLQCTLCDLIFSTLQRLESHMKVIHNTVKYGCKVCNVRFNTGKEYYMHTKRIEHLRKANIDKRYYCQQCDFAATHKYALESHINRCHLKSMPFVCDICNKSFINRYLLLAHKERHNQEKKYKCDVCNNLFCGSMALKKHKRLHTGERPYVCPHCNMGFISASHRQMHIKRKHGEKTEACPICKVKFNSLSELRRHVRMVHWKKDEEFDHTKFNCEGINDIFKDRRTIVDF